MSLDGYNEELLVAVPADAPEPLVAAIREVCAGSTVVETAYIGRVRRSSRDGSDVRELRVIAVEPSQPLTHHNDADRALMLEVADRLPEVDSRQEVSWLNENSLPVWQDRAIRVFER
jgi:hypothetical protein